jgi:hypothetical protein
VCVLLTLHPAGTSQLQLCSSIIAARAGTVPDPSTACKQHAVQANPQASTSHQSMASGRQCCQGAVLWQWLRARCQHLPGIHLRHDTHLHNAQLHTTPEAPSQHNCVHGRPGQQLCQPETRVFQAGAGT